MRHKNINYYYHTVLLRLLSVFYRFHEKNDQLNLKSWDSNSNVHYRYQTIYSSFSHFTHAEQLKASLKFNDQGIPLTNIDVKEDQLNPLFPAYWALVNWNQYKSENDEKALKVFLLQAEKLIELSKSEEYGRILLYEGKHSRYGTSNHWFSGITQAQSASVLLRLWELKQEDIYMIMAKELLLACLHPVKEGGVLVNSRFGPWVAEYPSQQSPLVLNGFIFVIIAFIEYLSLSKETQLENALNGFLNSLIEALPYYIFPLGTKYCLRQQKMSNIEYQALYISQFKHLYQLTSISDFKQLQENLNNKMNWKRFHSFYRY